jgi:hypothetical protein
MDIFGNSDKSIVLKAFNKQLFDFLDELIAIYPDNVEILTGKETFESLRKLNPTSLIKSWYLYVYIPYHDTISSGNIEFFMEKDYGADFNNAGVDNANSILEMIDKVRGPIKELSQENRKHATKYIQNLSKLSLVYEQLTK